MQQAKAIFTNYKIAKWFTNVIKKKAATKLDVIIDHHNQDLRKAITLLHCLILNLKDDPGKFYPVTPCNLVEGEKTIVWVDDNPANNAKDIETAKSLEVTVLEAESTTKAMSVLTDTLLSQSSFQLRLISDYYVCIGRYSKSTLTR